MAKLKPPLRLSKPTEGLFSGGPDLGSIAGYALENSVERGGAHVSTYNYIRVVRVKEPAVTPVPRD